MLAVKMEPARVAPEERNFPPPAGPSYGKPKAEGSGTVTSDQPTQGTREELAEVLEWAKTFRSALVRRVREPEQWGDDESVFFENLEMIIQRSHRLLVLAAAHAPQMKTVLDGFGTLAIARGEYRWTEATIEDWDTIIYFLDAVLGVWDAPGRPGVTSGAGAPASAAEETPVTNTTASDAGIAAAEYNRTLGERLFKTRKRRKETQKQAGYYIGLSQSQWSLLETGKRILSSEEQRHKVRQYLEEEKP